jgi:thiol-disulfide isomerase/thioredoxin
MNNRRKLVVLLGAAAVAGTPGLMMSHSAAAQAPAVNMADVRQLAGEPVQTIFAGAPIGRITDADYWKIVRGSPKPVVVIFYANQGQPSRHLATLARYLAQEFSPTVVFYGYQVTEGTTVEHNTIAALQKRYGIKKVPATLFYDNDRGKIELEKTDYSVPAMVEYRTPSLLFWNTYYQTTRDYIRKNILD